ncbi:MAG: efflux RND transporter permease subunit [Bdellovibrionales bacterium]
MARPVATTLLTLSLILSGIAAFFMLPVSPLPQVDFPTIIVQAAMPGASPETMASSVATPLERHLGHIAGVSEMTSQSTLGNTRVTLQFDMSRNIDGAARDVQAAINAARVDLPAALKSNPTYRKMNPADAPIMILTLTSDTATPGQMYDAASTILSQKLSQIEGVGQITVGGGSLPAVRAELNPRALFKYGVGLEDVRAALATANANAPKGALDTGDKTYQILTNDQAQNAEDYRDLVVAWRGNAPIRLSDLGDVRASVEDVRNLGLYNGKPSVVLILFKQPGANIVETIDSVREILPLLRASIPAAMTLSVAMDRSTTIRASLTDVERSLIISTALVIFVVFVFLRSGRATLIPFVAVPASLIGTFGAMYLLGYSLNILSLMALTIATGFVVDDAIVVLENIARHMEAGMPRRKAALQGAKEVGFTVISMSISLIAVFLPILLMDGIVGRLFREFSVVLSVAILISLALSLTTTPMMCARILRVEKQKKTKLFIEGQKQDGMPAFAGMTAGIEDSSLPKSRHAHEGGRPMGISLLRSPVDSFLSGCERAFAFSQRVYEKALRRALRHERIVLFILFATIGVNVWMFTAIPKGFFPQQDTGMLMGSIQADQSISFQAMKEKMRRLVAIVNSDPAVEGVNAFTGGSQVNSGFMFVALKPVAERKVSATQVIDRLRDKLRQVEGASLFLQAGQDIRMGGRPGNAQYQYTLQSDSLQDLRAWTPVITEALRRVEGLTDVNSDQQDAGQETKVVIDRDAAARLGITVSQINNTLYDAFGQRQVSTIKSSLNQYHVVMEVAPEFWQNPETLDEIYISASGGGLSGTESTGAAASSAARNNATNSISSTGKGGSLTGSAISASASAMIPLAALARHEPGAAPLGVNHQGHFAATTISFNLPAGQSLGDATKAIKATMDKLGVPANVHGSFQGTAQIFQKSLENQGILILAALLAVYIALGILYESLIHPLTILSTLPSAGVGALLALWICGHDFDIIGMIGVILLIGIVKKNAIMMIDFALDAERREGLDSREAIAKACLMRFRPIMMTTMAAMLGALPLALGSGDGAELRRPLGIAIVGGLIVSQALTLFTTPIVYLYLDRLRMRFLRRKGIVEKVIS